MNSPGAPRTARAGRRDPATGRGLTPYLAAFVIGLLSSIQSRMNGGLAVMWESPRQAAFYSFGTGLVIMTIVAVAAPGVREGLRDIWRGLRAGTLRWWAVIGGLLGGVFVLAQSSIVPLVGVAAFAVGVVAGQTANSLVVDRWGIGPGGRIPVSGPRIMAAVLAVMAVAVAVGGHALEVEGDGVLPIAAAFLVGAVIAFQQAINGRVARASGQPLAATWLNFALGTLLLGVVFGISVVQGGHVVPMFGGHPLLYLGGLVGVFFIALAAWAVTRIGVLVTSLLAVAGQLTSAVALDLWLPTAEGGLTAGLAVGVALAFLAVLIGARQRTR